MGVGAPGDLEVGQAAGYADGPLDARDGVGDPDVRAAQVQAECGVGDVERVRGLEGVVWLAVRARASRPSEPPHGVPHGLGGVVGDDDPGVGRPREVLAAHEDPLGDRDVPHVPGGGAAGGDDPAVRVEGVVGGEVPCDCEGGE